MLGEMLCSTGGSQRTVRRGCSGTRRVRGGHYDRATPGLEGLNRARQTETLVSKVGHSAKLKSSLKMTPQNGTLDSIYSTFPVHSVSANFKRV